MNSTLLQQTLRDNNYNNDEIILIHYNKARELPHFSQMINSKKNTKYAFWYTLYYFCVQIRIQNGSDKVSAGWLR